MLLLATPTVSAEEIQPNSQDIPPEAILVEPPAPALPQLDISGSDQEIGIVILNYDNLSAIKLAAESLLQNSDIRYTVFQGQLPQIILIGPPGKVKPVADILRSLAEQPTTNKLVSISAVLQELSKEQDLQYGVNIKNVSISGQSNLLINSGKTVDHQFIGTSGIDISYQDANNTGKVIAASEVLTPNGIKAELKSADKVPVLNRDSSGYITTEYKDVETTIAVTPTVISFNEANPGESLVRLDISIKVGLMARERTLGQYSAPQISVREVNTTRIIKADNREYIVATIIRDEDFKSKTGIPLLDKLPLIGELVSSRKNHTIRTTAYLKLAVRLLPN